MDVDPVATDGDGASRCILALRLMLRETISPELTLSPAADILLILYLAHGTALSWTEICEGAGSGEGTCRRWCMALRDRGLVELDAHGCRLTGRGERVMADINDGAWRIITRHLADGRRPISG